MTVIENKLASVKDQTLQFEVYRYFVCLLETSLAV